MKKIVTTLVFVISGLAFSQVGINAGKTSEGDPHNLADDAVLHVENATGQHKGVLLPSVALTSDTDQTTTSGGSVSTGLMVWNDGTAALKPAGYYYWNGSEWISVNNGTFVKNIRSDNRKAVVVDQDENGLSIDGKDYYIIMTGNPTTLKMPNATKSKGRVICAYNPGTEITAIDPQPQGPVQTVDASQVACFISDGIGWFNSNGY